MIMYKNWLQIHYLQLFLLISIDAGFMIATQGTLYVNKIGDNAKNCTVGERIAQAERSLKFSVAPVRTNFDLFRVVV